MPRRSIPSTRSAAGRLLSRNGAGTGPEGARVSRIPAGHPEGYLEGFANIYAEVAAAIRAARSGAAPDPAVTFPDVVDGLRGMRFIQAAVASAGKGNVWTRVPAG